MHPTVISLQLRRHTTNAHTRYPIPIDERFTFIITRLRCNENTDKAEHVATHKKKRQKDWYAIVKDLPHFHFALTRRSLPHTKPKHECALRTIDWS